MNRDHQSTRSQLLASLAFAFALFAPQISWAQICGDGDLNVGEQCDDGNLVDDDCCNHLCRLVPAGTICRASSLPCDVAEACQAFNGICPDDTGITGDTDGDGLCDASDACPDVIDPEQEDRDEDGLGDACDPCTNVFPGFIDSAKLRLRKLGLEPGRQRLKFRGMLQPPPGTLIDPATTGLRFVLTDGSGRTSIDVTLPAGAYDPATRIGWKPNGGGTAWIYADHAGSVDGIKKVLIRTRIGGDAHFVIFGQDGGYLLPAVEPVRATVVLAPPFAVAGDCAEMEFPPDACRFRNSESKLLCR